MNEQIECVCNISKAGRNLFARIPDKVRDRINRGDLVKIIVLEKAVSKDEHKLRQIVKEFVKNPKGEKVKGTIAGFPIEIPFARIISAMEPNQAEELLMSVLLGK